jgi:hypothetical protein
VSRESDAHARAQEAMKAAGDALVADPENKDLQRKAVAADAALYAAEQAVERTVAPETDGS